MNQHCFSDGKRLTQQHCAIATIKSFKPIFQRIPTGTVGKMTISETLALSVDSVQIVGGAGEPEFGSPRTLDTHSELNEWMEGLRAGDGSGCVPAIPASKRINVVQECFEAEERKKISPRARGKLCDGDAHCLRAT